MVIAMANKLWTGTQSEFTNLGTYQLDDIFSTKVNETYSYIYHDAPALTTLQGMNMTQYITVNADGSCTPDNIADLVSRFSMTSKTINMTLPRLNKFYRGKGGSSVESLFGSKTVDGVTSSKSLADITEEVRNKYFY